MMHYMNLCNDPYLKILNETKTIEMRLNDERRKSIKKDDIIEFSNNETQEKMRVVVLKKHEFRNFEELYRVFDKTLLGYDKNEVAHPKDMQLYYDEERITKYGVLAIEIKLLKR